MTSNYSTFVINEQNIENLIIDPIDDKMYFKTDIGVNRANFDGNNKEVIYQHEKKHIRLFALDWIGRQMFFVYTTLTTSIFVGSMNLTNDLPLHDSEESISSLAVDPNAG